ncbi:MAG: hypothetical protein JWP97_1140 [Labilithrix sp.]|nr:hypothetical protein [Labilithrix sp.]
MFSFALGLASRPSLVLLLAAGASFGCSRPETAAPDAAPAASSAVVASPAVSTAPATGASGAATADASAATTSPGTIGLLVEKVTVRNTAQGTGREQGYDLVVLHDAQGTGKTVRIHPACPPGKPDMFGMCKHYRSCAIATDAGAAGSVTCDGSTLRLVQRDGATFLEGEGAPLSVAPDQPALLAPATRPRTASVDL